MSNRGGEKAYHAFPLYLRGKEFGLWHYVFGIVFDVDTLIRLKKCPSEYVKNFYH